MKVTANELGIINMALQVEEDKSPKQYPLLELDIALSIFKELKNNVDWEMFKDWDMDLWTKQKWFLIEQLDRKWPLLDAEAVFSLKEKLK